MEIDNYNSTESKIKNINGVLVKNVPLIPTDEMRDEGAQRLVKVESEGDWPSKFSPLQRAAARNEAERVWLSMWIAAKVD